MSEPHHQIPLPDGRVLALDEWGDPNRRPVVFISSSPGSRLLCPDAAATRAAEVRLFTVDRPGYGWSSPDGDPTLTGFADDLGVAFDRLELPAAPVIGWSRGGQYALAASSVLGERVPSVALLGTPAPGNVVPWVPDEFHPALEAVERDPKAAMAPITGALGWYAETPEAAADYPGTADSEMRTRPEVVAALDAMLREGARTGVAGLVADIVAGHRTDVALEVASVTAPVTLWYGDDDQGITPAHAAWYQANLARATTVILPATGHLLPFDHWAPILRGVAPP